MPRRLNSTLNTTKHRPQNSLADRTLHSPRPGAKKPSATSRSNRALAFLKTVILRCVIQHVSYNGVRKGGGCFLSPIMAVVE